MVVEPRNKVKYKDILVSFLLFFSNSVAAFIDQEDASKFRWGKKKPTKMESDNNNNQITMYPV